MLEILRVALTSIRGNLFRAALTMLGVIIGVAAVITMLALGTGAQRAVEQQLAALGANVITVTTGMRFAQGVAREQQVLTTDDAASLREGARNVTAVSPEQNARQQVKLGNRNLNLSVIGTAPGHPAVNGYSMQAGRMFTAIAGSVPVQLDVEVSGEITEHDVSIWELSALKGLFTDVTEDPVTYVNAPLMAKERGCDSRLVTTATADDFRNVTTLVGTLADGTTVSVAGTLTGPKMVEKVVGVNGFDLEIPISDYMVFFSYVDRPGVIGAVGKLLGDADVNIAGMQVSRIDERGEALVALTVDSPIPEDVVAAIATEVGTETLRTVDLA